MATKDLFLWFSQLLPDKRLQDERRRTLLKLQLFIMQSFGVGTTFSSSLTKQHNAIIISEGQRTLEREINREKLTSAKLNLNFNEQFSVSSTVLYLQLVGLTLELS